MRARTVFSLLGLVATACAAVLWFASYASTNKTSLPAASETSVRGKPRLIIEARIGKGKWVKVNAIYPLVSQDVSLRVKKIPNARVRWFSIRPDSSTLYKNANYPWDADPYKWIGLAKIKYSRKELVEFHDRFEIQPFDQSESASVKKTTQGPGKITEDLFNGKPSRPKQYGSFWFQAEVERNGRFVRSYGIEDNDKRGLNPKVFRVSRRAGNGYLGYLTTFFNVPGLFGSIPYQSHNYIGVDCADVLVAAYGKWKNVRFKKDQYVAGLVTALPKTVKFELRGGNPKPRIRWGKQVRPGYLIAVKYFGARSFQHIGALAKDANKNGLLDGPDLVLHAGPHPLSYCSLKEGKFDGHVAILQPDLSRLSSRHGRTDRSK